MKESPLFTKTYDLLLWLHKHTGHYPKNERFRLAKRIDDTAFELQECILFATLDNNKHENLIKADIILRKLTILCRLAKDTGFMTSSQYFYVSERMVELGKMVNAWKKKVERL
jgi:hypothetical protein